MFVLSINLMRLDAQQITHNILKLNLIFNHFKNGYFKKSKYLNVSLYNHAELFVS